MLFEDSDNDVLNRYFEVFYKCELCQRNYTNAMDRIGLQFGVVRFPGESDDQLRSRVIEYTRQFFC